MLRVHVTGDVDPETLEPIWRACPDAAALPSGAVALAYSCEIHPQFQRGQIIVRAA